MKTKLFFLLTIMTSILVLGQSDSLLYSYKIPTYSYHNMSLFGEDFINYSKINNFGTKKKTEKFNINLGLTEEVVHQDAFTTKKMFGVMTFNYNSINKIYPEYNSKENKMVDKDHKNETSMVMLGLASSNSWYFNDEKGISVFSDPALLFAYYFSESSSEKAVDFPIGVGYGRIVGVKNVVQSYIISKEIGTQLTDEKLLKLAEIIEKYNNGLYYAKFRDNEKIEFFKDIDSLTNKPEHAFKIEQIINSALYKTSERFVGWQIKFGANLSLISAESWTNYSDESLITTDLFVSAEYALPINFDKQIIASLNYSKNLDNEKSHIPKLRVATRFMIDHNYTWSSTFSANYTKAFPEKVDGRSNKDVDNWTNLKLTARTDVTILNSFSVYASLDYLNKEFLEINFLNLTPLSRKTNKTEHIEFHLGFNLYIL